MFNNYLKTAFRNLRRHKGYSFINIAGLSIGLASCILILLWVWNNLSYDHFHEHADNLYRIIRIDSVDPTKSSRVVPLPLVPAVKEELPEVVAATRYTRYGRHLFRYGDQTFYEENTIVVDADFFKMFSFPLIEGNLETVFSDPFSIVITREIATKYFGGEDPIGKVFTVDNEDRFTVTGVIERSRQSHIRFDIIFSFEFLGAKGYDMNQWGDVSYLAYVHLYDNSSLDEVKGKMSAIIARHVPEYSGIRSLQPVKDIYYRYVRDQVISFSAIALVILVIACINFMNISTARSETRSTEIGMRKVTGARRTNIIGQLLGESYLITFLASFLAVVLVALFLPYFEAFAGEVLNLERLIRLDVIVGLLGIIVVTGLLSGLYPALFFSAVRPVDALKKRSHKGMKSAGFRKQLVVVQFTLSIILIVCTVVISRQFHYLKNSEIGYDKENLLYVRMRGNFKAHGETIKHELLAHPNIRSISLVDQLPTMWGWGTDSPDWEGKQEGMRVQFNVRCVDPDFANTFGIEMAEGRFFSESFSTDGQAFIVNEAAVRAMGMENPVNKWMEYAWIERRGPIIGVVKDYHFVSLHNAIEPLILMIKPDEYRYMCLKVASAGMGETLGFVEQAWKDHEPGFPFEFHFLDQSLERLYSSEQRSAALVRTFSMLAILISCLGLLGMVSFILERRTKEIGIRKVLGASIPKIILLFTKTFIKWVAAANVIAWPIAYVLMSRWLQNYPYHTALHWWIFALSGITALAIALTTIGVQVIRAARANPVEALRYE